MITGRLAAPSGDAPFSDGVIVEGRLAFLAGQGPIHNGTIVRGPIREQTEVTLCNLARCLARLGADKSAVITAVVALPPGGPAARPRGGDDAAVAPGEGG
jgi:enamine deaminase RidA (YjgF/YER057c/UK114 family)